MTFTQIINKVVINFEFGLICWERMGEKVKQHDARGFELNYSKAPCGKLVQNILVVP